MSNSALKKTITILVITLGFQVIFFFTNNPIFLKISIVIVFLSALFDKAVTFISYLWHKLSELLALIVPNIILSIVYFLVLFPTALLRRLFKSKDALKLKNISSTTFEDRNKNFAHTDIINPW